jgi:hypothetical protein
VVIAIGGLFALIIIAAVGMSLISSGGKEKTAQLLAVVQEQTEIIRIATVATQHTTGVQGQNLSQNVEATLTSDNTALLTYLAKNGQKPTSKELAAKRSTTTDTTLSNAQENNTYDNAFKDVIQTELNDYVIALNKAYKTNPGPKGKALLLQQYNSAVLLQTASKAN